LNTDLHIKFNSSILHILGLGTAVEIVYDCITEMGECQNRKEKHVLMLKKIRMCCKDINRLDRRGSKVFFIVFIICYYVFVIID
jgi:hypothetical protein